MVHTLTVGGCQANCYIVFDEINHAAVIDPGDEAARILAEICRFQFKVDAVLLTHAHFDHMMAAAAVLAETGAPLMITEADAPALHDPATNLWSWGHAPAPCTLKPDRLLHDGDTLTVGRMTLRVMETPGHTVGSCCFLTDDGIFTGDTLFAGSIGRMDLPGGNPRRMLESLRRLTSLPGDAAIFPGHGEATRMLIEKQSNPYLRRHAL